MLECSMVKDILPLYEEGMTSDETSSLIAAHLEECPSCAAAWRAMHDGTDDQNEAEQQTAAVDCLKRVEGKLRKRNLTAIICSALAVLTLVLCFTVLMYQSGRIGVSLRRLYDAPGESPYAATSRRGASSDGVPVFAAMGYTENKSSGYYYVYIQKKGLNIGWHLIMLHGIEPGNGIVEVDIQGYGKAYFALNQDHSISTAKSGDSVVCDFVRDVSDVVTQITDGTELEFYDAEGNRLIVTSVSVSDKGVVY